MKAVAALALLLAGCAAAGVGPAATRVLPDGETWRYYPKQPFGRKVLVERIAPDGRLIALEQRLSEEYIAKLVPNHSRKDDVHTLFGPPYETSHFPRMNREVWSWHMRQFGDLPVGLHVQMSPDGVVREVYLLDEGRSDRAKRFR